MKEARPQGAARHDTITRRNINAQQPTVPSVSLNDDLQPQADCNSGTASSYVVFSGGTAANDFVTAFRSRETSFVLPVSDDGGSSSEILRVLGGPSIGDIRSRLIRLIPFRTISPANFAGSASERVIGVRAIHDLFAHRFPAQVSEAKAREAWMDLVEGRSALWRDIPEDRKECIRAFFVHFNTLILRRAHKRFSFRNCSVGNCFLAAARDMLGGLPGAIFMFKAVTDSQDTGEVIPVILTNQRITIAAELSSGRVITGQCEISHPAPPTPLPTRPSSRQSRRRRDSMSFSTVESSDEDASGSESEGSVVGVSSDGQLLSAQAGISTPAEARPGSPWRDPTHLPQLGGGSSHLRRPSVRRATSTQQFDELADQNSLYVKGTEEVPLESRIERLFYINVYGQEILPDPNPEVTKSLARRTTLVYSCGSLWTSIIPCLCLRGVATAIARSPALKHKILLLNSTNDRETTGYVASDYLKAIVGSLNRYDRRNRASRTAGGRRYDASSLVTHLVYLEEGKVPIDSLVLEDMNVKLVQVPSAMGPTFSSKAVSWALQQIERPQP